MSALTMQPAAPLSGFFPRVRRTGRRQGIAARSVVRRRVLYDPEDRPIGWVEAAESFQGFGPGLPTVLLRRER